MLHYAWPPLLLAFGQDSELAVILYQMNKRELYNQQEISRVNILWVTMGGRSLGGHRGRCYLLNIRWVWTINLHSTTVFT